MFKTGDIVLNFKRSSIYLFDESILQHRKETFSCRIATFNEQAKLKALGVDKCKLSEIGIKKDWQKLKDVRLELRISSSLLLRLNTVGKVNGLISYEAIINKLLSAYNNPDKGNKKALALEKELEVKNDMIKQITKLMQNS